MAEKVAANVPAGAGAPAPAVGISREDLERARYTGDVFMVAAMRQNMDEEWEFVDDPHEALFKDMDAAIDHALLFTDEMASKHYDGTHPTVSIAVLPYEWADGSERDAGQAVYAIDYPRSGETVLLDQRIGPEPMTVAVRHELAANGQFTALLAKDPSWRVRCALARNGYELPTLVYDPMWPVREAIARRGYRLDLLVDDESSSVRIAVANQGYGLDLLCASADRDAYNAAHNYLRHHGQLTPEAWVEKNPGRCALPWNRCTVDVIGADLEVMADTDVNPVFGVAKSFLDVTDWFNVMTGELVCPDINDDGRFYGFQTYRFTPDRAARALEDIAACGSDGMCAQEYAFGFISAPGSGCEDRLDWQPFSGIQNVVDVAEMVAGNDGWIVDCPTALRQYVANSRHELGVESDIADRRNRCALEDARQCRGHLADRGNGTVGRKQ